MMYAYTGGKAFNPAQPTVLMIHGVLNDHSVWILQSRYLAHHGWNVLAIDLPGHAKSGGSVPTSVEAAAQAITDDMLARGLQKIAIVGHSWGSLIALSMAASCAQNPSASGLQVTHLSLVGTAYPMKVGAALLNAAKDDPHQAITMVNTFSHSTLSPPPSSLGPGTWLYGGSAALMRRVLTNSAPVEGSNVFYAGFKACNDYAGGEVALQAVSQAHLPVQFIFGLNDQMTPPKAAQSLLQLCPHARVDKVPAGHAMMSEAPDQVLFAICQFLGV